MHPKNKHAGRYDFNSLTKALPELQKFVMEKHGDNSIDFSDAKAVKLLNQALLKSIYGIEFWDLPEGHLTPPIPGRADYIHFLSELPGLASQNVRALDIGTGASLIYPLIGAKEYNWSFVGTDINAASISFAQNLISKNHLENKITLRLQTNPENVLKGIIEKNDKFDFTMCNPPFYGSAEEALSENARKSKNLGTTAKRNFGGSTNELWTPGGEKNFVRKMIFESVDFKSNVKWFTSLVSKSEHLEEFERIAKKVGAISRIQPMDQGQKRSRFIAWSFS